MSKAAVASFEKWAKGRPGYGAAGDSPDYRIGAVREGLVVWQAALAAAKAHPEAAQAEPINYFIVGEFASKHNLDYNELCTMVRESLRLATTASKAEPSPSPDSTQVPTDAAYSYAANLAQAIFNSEYASDPDYASGKVKWQLCDDLLGVLTQIDNMVSGMKRVQSAPVGVAQPVGTAPTGAQQGEPLYQIRVYGSNTAWYAVTEAAWLTVPEKDRRIVYAAHPQGANEPAEDAAPSAKQRKLMELADRIDHEQLCRWAGMDHHKMTPEQKDRMNAGVALRRYADLWAPGRWIVFPPVGPVHFSASTLDKAVEMAKRDEVRQAEAERKSAAGEN
jgi:hypothetical protein